MASPSAPAYPEEFSGSTLTLTSTDPPCVKVYFDSRANHRFSLGLGQCFDKGWIHVGSVESSIIQPDSWEDYAWHEDIKMLVRAPEYAQAMNKARSGSEGYGQICVMQIRFPQTNQGPSDFVRHVEELKDAWS